MSTRGPVIALLSLGACVDTQSLPTEPPAQPIVILISPVDLTSNVGGASLSVGFSPPVATDSTANEAASLVRLRTYPELVDVPFALDVHARVDGGYMTDGSTDKDATVNKAEWVPPSPARIDVLPNSPLAMDRWYVLSVSDVPTGIAPNPVTTPGPLGAYAVRFTTGRAPIIQDVHVGRGGGLIVDFSEAVAIDDKTVGQFLSVFDNVGAPCSYVPNSAGLPAMDGIFFHCAATTYSSKAASLKLSPGLKNEVGTPLGTLNAAATTAASLVDTSAQTIPLTFVDDGRDDARWHP